MVHTFGGKGWTDDKLEVMRRYFTAYAQALKNQSFRKLYIDAFAGTGERADTHTRRSVGRNLFGDDEVDIGAVKDGSARIALSIEPPFDQYIFVDQSREHVEALGLLRGEFPTRRIEICEEDANDALRRIAQQVNWRATRAAVFIDPYGLQVSWTTLEILAATKSVDVALLFPTGPLTRMLTRDGKIPAEWERRIDDHLGVCEWRTAFYASSKSVDLFSHQNTDLKKFVDPQGLREFAAKRLEEIFPYVCSTQLELKNSRGSILYHLFIICANPSSAATNLANRLASSAMSLGRQGRR
jgi:three-Cys-motif partner protein